MSAFCRRAALTSRHALRVHRGNAVIPGLVFFFPAWVAVMALAYLFRTATRAWVWLGAANVAAFGLLWLVRDAVGVI